MNTIYQLRDNDTDEEIGLYTFEKRDITESKIKKLYEEYLNNVDNYEDFESYLNSCGIEYTRLFIEEVYV